MHRLIDILKDESGVEAIEYALITGLISVAIIQTLTMVGQNLTAVFNTVAFTLSNATAR